MLGDEGGDQLGLGDRGRPEHDAIRAHRESRAHRLGVPQAAAELDREVDPGGDPLHVVEVLRVAGSRPIEVDHVEEPRALLLPAARRIQRLGVVDGLVLILAAKQPHRVPAPDVDRRIEDHHQPPDARPDGIRDGLPASATSSLGRVSQIRVKLASRRSPAAPDFSGWNWTP